MATPTDWNYETAIAAIEGTINQLERGDLPLEEIFTAFEAAVADLRQCDRFLADKQAQVDLLLEELQDLDG